MMVAVMRSWLPLLAVLLLAAGPLSGEPSSGEPSSGEPSSGEPSSAGSPTAAPGRFEAVRLSADAFGTRAEIEVHGLPRAQAAAAAENALHEIFDLSQLFDPASRLPGSIGALNAAAGAEETMVLEPRVADLLRRGLQFCLWTNGAHGPLGGELYRLWRRSETFPDPTELRQAVISAACNQLTMNFGETDTRARLAAGSRIEAVGLARGFAVDRAAEILERAGAVNAWLEIGSVWRAMGGGPDGEGWLATLPSAGPSREPADRVWLRNQSLAIASREPVGREPPIRLLDQRTGVPARGVVMVATVSELAVDAEALAITLFVTSLREGQMRLGALQPRPSVLWLLGEGEGTPVQSTFRWSELAQAGRY